MASAFLLASAQPTGRIRTAPNSGNPHIDSSQRQPALTGANSPPSFSAPRRARLSRHPRPLSSTRCPPGTTALPNRRSWTSSTRPPTLQAPSSSPPAERIATFDQDGTLWVEHPIYTPVMYCLDRVPVLAKAKPELEERRAIQDRALGRPRGDRETSMDRPRKDRRRHADRRCHVDAFQADVKKLAGNSQGSALEAPLHRTHLSADAGGAEVSARQWLQDLYRHRRRPGFRARLSRSRSMASRPSRWSARVGGEVSATTRMASRC